ncbi:MAG: acyltransferase [Lachnospiraceae bacterium]|nr:acyltransferase [Lachnospiraceae bacterium]
MSGKVYKISPEVSKKLSIIKFVSIAMVVFGHSLALPVFDTPIIVPGWIEMIKKVCTYVIIPVTMPGYFILSAIFLYSKPFRFIDNLKKKMRSIVLPYVLINTFWVIFFKVMSLIPQTAPLFASEQYRLETWMDLYNAYFGAFPLYYPFWFMRDLFVLNLLASILWIITDRMPFVGLAIGCVIGYSSFPVPFVSERCCILYWICGLLIVKYGFDLDRIEKIRFVDLIIAGAAMGVMTYLSHVPFVLTAAPLLALMYRLCGKLVPFYLRSEKLQIAVKQSFIIYAFHEYYEAMLKKVVMSHLPQTGAVQFLELISLPAVIIVCCIIAGHIMQTKLPRLYALIQGRRAR